MRAAVPYVLPVMMLAMSNLFMTAAWYGHLRFKAAPLLAVVLIGWGLAFFEYWLAVPANRIGYRVYSAAQLKTIQEVITLLVFVGFSTFWLKEAASWRVAGGFALIALGAGVIFSAPGTHAAKTAPPAGGATAASTAKHHATSGEAAGGEIRRVQ